MSTRRTRTAETWLAAIAVTTVLLIVSVQMVRAQRFIDLFRAACADGGSNPYVVTTIPRPGTLEDDSPTVVAFRDTRWNSAAIGLATPRQVGATYGLAYDPHTEVLYVAAHHKRGTHFGPSGPGAIYAIDIASGDVSTLAVVPNAGVDAHDPTDDYFPDLSGRFTAGRTSLGDLDINPDGSELAVVNLDDQRIYRIGLPGGDLISSFAHGAAQESWAGKDSRPFGLGYRGARLYHGVVRTAESDQDRDRMWAYVYESGPDGSDMSLIAETPLNFERGWIWFGDGRAIWNPWLDPPGNVAASDGQYPMPILSDIEFTDSGDQMMLGFRDRFGDQTFCTTPPDQPPSGERMFNTPAGDILPAWPSGSGWSIQVSPEFYGGDYGPEGNRQGHDETAYGGLAVVPGHGLVVTSATSPLQVNSAGALWLSTTTGEDERREELYRTGRFSHFGKANGLGDVEVLCPDKLETPTATVPSTVTVTPRATPTTGAPTPTPKPVPVYLPVVLGEECNPTRVWADVALVIDTSSSMTGTKLADAKDAALGFVGLLDLAPDRDRVAVVRFDADAELSLKLSADRAAVEHAVRELETRRGTRIDRGLREALAELRRPRSNPDNTPVVILLTDGRHTGRPGADLAAATEIRRAGIRPYAIGLGDDVDEEALIAVAGETGRYFYAPDSRQLASIYREVAREIDCPAGGFWGRR